ncbi:uncharacterized protein PAC_13627 [Phialocephala subalpina]|uniref:Uncharacterized protein n=1 Tax=Phialocephala subalpina TaxID=576137 RepID=A0A1L7XFA8_9HELO|nr:uncharacterized protein PAC_13627 [Phialocephala subalpina]
MAISRVAASLATIYNENAVSLANLNVDFTLIKMEAPVEFQGVGSTISEHRKINAEDGTLHKTARKLGALFESIIPSTPELCKAYGIRVSEVSKSTKINPKPSSRDGMFATHIGADSTSLWAAATSGDGAMGVHLLACMLARIWTGPQAISIWDELVVKRREDIQRQCAAAAYPSKYDSDVLATKQDISRESLAAWDASARAWVQSADQAESRRHTQLMLILDNINVPVNNEKDLFRSVTVAWFTALRAMENLAKASSRLSSAPWNVILALIPGYGCARRSDRGRQTERPALPVFGSIDTRPPVRRQIQTRCFLVTITGASQSSCSVGPANSRISIDQFAYVMLGCVFGRWNEYASTPTMGVTWLLRLHDLLDKPSKRLDDTNDHTTLPNFGTFSTPQNNSPPTEGFHAVQAKNSWMGWLFNVGHRLLETRGLEKKLAMQLVTLGKRRTAALCPGQNVPCPLFGLSDPSILIPIMSNHEARIKFLRGLATKLSLDATRHVIRYKRGTNINICPFEYATTLPLSSIQQPGTTVHRRFLPITAYRHATNVLSCVCSPLCAEACPCRLRTTDCSLLCHNGHDTTVRNCKNGGLLDFVLRRCFDVQNMAEEPEALCELLPYREGVSFADVLIKFCSGPSFESSLNGLLRQDTGTPLRDFVGLKLVCGDPDTAAIFELDYTKNVITPYAPPMGTAAATKSYVPQELLEDVLKVDMLDLVRLVDWLTTFRKPQSASILLRHTNAPGMQHYAPMPPLSHSLYSEYSSSLRAGVLAAQPEYQSHLLAKVELSRAQAFACIAMFDSGSCNLDPAGLQEAFALSSGNSIYVAAPLLCDPSEVPTPKEIRRVTGSIGRSGITVLIPPGEPKCRVRDDESWIHVNHLPFDGKLENCFQQATLHLTFTAYELPLSDGSHGQHIIDRPASLVETVVSVHDRGEWVADLDVLSALNKRRSDGKGLSNLRCGCSEHHSAKRKAIPDFQEIFGAKGSPLISIDNWDEFLDLPSGSVLIIRAYQNWLARLAFTVMSVDHGRRTVVLSDDICWLCCKESLDNAVHENTRSTVLIC